MKLLNKLITKTAIYKHLKDLYEQALKDCEEFQENTRKDCKDIQELKEKLENANSELIIIKKQLKKIRTRANRLSKTNMYVQSIKQLIKEVL